MTDTNKERNLTVIGRVERVSLPSIGATDVPAKIDTGADSSSIWVHKTHVDGKQLKVIFFGPDTPFYDGREHVFASDEFEVTRVANSFGVRELRYKVRLTIKLKGRTIKGTFTLANRANKLYPVLIGRALLTHKFLVDVSAGSPLKHQERGRKRKMHEELHNIKEVSE